RGLLSRPLRSSVCIVLAARPPDFLAQITGADRSARLTAARAVWLNRLSRLQSARPEAPAFPGSGPSHRSRADVACHVSLFLYLSHRALHPALDMGSLRALFRGDDAQLAPRHRAPRTRCSVNSDISPADCGTGLPLYAGL